MNRCLKLTCIAVVAMFAVRVQAADIYWLGGTGNLTDSNYSSAQPPQETDLIFLGNSGTVTHSVGGIALFQKIRVGHDLATPGGVGTATLTVNNGAQISLTSPGGTSLASVIIGNGAPATLNSGFSGTLNIDGVGSSVTSAQLVQIGFGSQLTANATVNITNGGSLVASSGNINLGERNGATGVGVPGHLKISGATSSLTITNGTADLNIGVRAASDYEQTDGIVSIGDSVFVGINGAQNSSFKMTGGTLTTNPTTGGSFTVGDDNAHGSKMEISGGTITARSFSIGPNANNASASITGNAIINVTANGNNFNVGTGDAQNASVLVADTASISVPNTAASTGNVFIGRDTSVGAKFTMTGGTIFTGRNFLLGNATGATGIVGTQSGGTITTSINFVVADTNGGSIYNLSGTGAIVTTGQVVVGRQTTAANSGVMNQTGGSVTAGTGITVGNAQDVNTALWGTGIYNVSGGTITANQTTGTALTIGTQGKGTFRVIGDDTTLIDVNGNMTVNAGGGSQGTLAFQLEPGDLLSQIDVSGTATFVNGSILNLDTTLASPTQTTYNVLTAASFVGIDSPNDPDITFNGPAGWGFQLVPGGNGQILQLYQLPPAGLLGDFNNDTKVDAGDYATWRKNEVANAALANDNNVGNQAARFDLWRANFGNPPGSGSGLNSAQVPEPTTFGLLALGLSSVMTLRRRNRLNVGE